MNYISSPASVAVTTGYAICPEKAILAAAIAVLAGIVIFFIRRYKTTSGFDEPREDNRDDEKVSKKTLTQRQGEGL